jgi:hypothetical protein
MRVRDEVSGRYAFLEMTDSLGSTSMVIDKDSGDLVERTSPGYAPRVGEDEL